MDTARTLALVGMTTLFYATPGPAVLSLALSGSAFGVRRSAPYVMGLLVGLMSNLGITGLGLAVVFERFPTVGLIFRYGSLVYVLYLATKLFQPAHAADGSRRPLRFVDGIVLNLINPKAYAASLTILGAFAETGADYAASFVWIFCVLLAVGTLVDVLWLSAGAYLSRTRWSGGMPQVWNATFAGLLVLSVFVSVFWK